MHNHILPLEMGLQLGVKSGQVNWINRDTPGPWHKIEASNHVTEFREVLRKLAAQMTSSACYKDAQYHCFSVEEHPQAFSDPGA